MPRPLHWISPRMTGRFGFPRTKQETMSVPPEIEARLISSPMARYAQSKVSGSRGEPVESTHRNRSRFEMDLGSKPDLSSIA